MRWDKKKLGNYCTVVRGSSPRPKGDPRYYGGNIPRLMVSDVTRDGMYVTPKVDSLTEEGAKKSRPMKAGSVIIAVSGDPGQSAILTIDACIHDGFVGLRELDEKFIFKPFLYQYLNYFKENLKSGAVGAIYKNLNTQQIREIKIPLPPLAIQKQIAELLNTADALRRQTQAQLDQLDALAQSVFLEMFGDPKVNDKKWEIQPFDFFADFDTKMTNDFKKYANTPHIGIANIEKGTGRLINYNFVKDENLSSGKYIFSPEHIIYSKIRPNLNKVALPNFIGLCSADSYPILVKKENANKIFFTQLLRSDAFIEFILSHSSRTNIPKANKKQMSLFKGIAPPLALQTQFAEIIENIEQQKEQLESSLRESEGLFGGLLQEVFG